MRGGAIVHFASGQIEIAAAASYWTIKIKIILSVTFAVYLRNEFHFSEVYRSVNYIGSRAKWINSEGVYVNFASHPM